MFVLYASSEHFCVQIKIIRLKILLLETSDIQKFCIALKMLKYALIILLINTYNCGLGNPVQTSNGKTDTASNNLANMLINLTNNCRSQVISSEIHNKTANCIAALSSSQKLKCWTFYDINKQLCNLSLDLKTEDYNMQINKKLDVQQFCTDATSWPVTDLKFYPEYSNLFKKIFSSSTICTMFCQPQDIFNTDVDFYCKYYKFGLDILAKSNDTQLNTSTKLESEHIPHIPQVQTNDSTSQIPKPSKQEKADSHQLETDNAEIKKTDEVSADQTGVSNNSKQLVLGQTNLALHQNEISGGISDAGDQHTTTPNILNSMEEQSHNIPNEKPETDETEAIEGADQDSERDTNTFQETEMVDDIHSDKKPDIGKQFPDLPNEADQKEINNGRTQDSIMEDEDDHFFTLFLIGVIFVILLYVLYHNKNKVSKVVMGLIVEGRAGRRRNSRGHAYRRLDTLEQAVSASHPTPPTKIIY